MSNANIVEARNIVKRFGGVMALDKAEFLEAMILVLDDVRLQNIRTRDYAMMEIVTDEIPRYEERLEETKSELEQLRQDFWASQESIAN